MNKKSLLVFAIACLSFISCKKDRVCECTYTEGSETGTANITFFDARKGDARLWCTSISTQYDEVTPVAATGDKTSCKLK
jgi:hypothetical protein